MSNNIAASVHQRLLNKAKSEKRTFNELLQYYAMERFLYRLGQSAYADRFLLKGAMVFQIWQVSLSRPTRDIDFLGYTENTAENLERIVRDVCILPVKTDGMKYDGSSITVEIINERVVYHGIRVIFQAFLGKARVPMQLDIGFDDVVTPSISSFFELPTLLENFPNPSILAYPPETVVAEKFQTLVDLGMINSRIKDFYDLWIMTQVLEFDFSSLHTAIRNTFAHRNTLIPNETPIALTEDFGVQKQNQWISFLDKNQLTNAPTDFTQVLTRLLEFFKPVIDSSVKIGFHWTSTSGWIV